MSRQTAARSTVLVVERDRSLARQYAQWLQTEYMVGVAEDVDGALSAVGEVGGEVDVVLVGAAGAAFADEVVVAIRDRGLDSRVVLLGGTDSAAALERGYDDLVGTVTEEALLETVESLAEAGPYEHIRVELSHHRVRRNVLERELSRAQLFDHDRYNWTLERIDELERLAAAYRTSVGRPVPAPAPQPVRAPSPSDPAPDAQEV